MKTFLLVLKLPTVATSHIKVKVYKYRSVWDKTDVFLIDTVYIAIYMHMTK